MDIDSKIPGFSGKNIITIILLATLITLPVSTEVSAPKFKNQEQGAFLNEKGMIKEENLVIIQQNTILPISSPLVVQKPKAKIIQAPKLMVIERKKMTITAYSSTPDQTDDTPFITASNTWVRKGIVANNFYPFGTKIRIPKFFGDKVFVVEDRMHWRKSNYHIDIWFPSRQEAINFGITKAYVEILAD
jgi:3D (Asp-Asp-Asp) domain-containing protein